MERYNLGFKRPERLDVKKPGPPFDSQISSATDKSTHIKTTIIKLHQIISDAIQSTDKDTLLPSMAKKEPRGAHPNPFHEPYDVDPNYVYVKFKER